VPELLGFEGPDILRVDEIASIKKKLKCGDIFTFLDSVNVFDIS
jgi:hypothetical protein